MPRDTAHTEEATGTLRLTASGWLAQFSIGGGKRKAVVLRTCDNEGSARRRQRAIAKLVNELRAAGHLATIPNIVRDSGLADAEAFLRIERLVARIIGGKEPGLSKLHGVRRDGTTVEELGKLWWSGELAEQFPDHVKVKKTRKGDERILGWLCKVRMPDGSTFGGHPVAALTLDDLDHVMGALPKGAESPSTRRQYGQAIRKLLTYAVYPLRLIPAVPIPKGWLPKIRNDKAKAWLYPSEDLALMGCVEVPIVRRLFYGFLAREGMRVSEALSLTWADVDLARGVVRLDTTKTDEARSWVMGEDVTRALVAWRKLRGKKADKVPHLFPPALIGRRPTSIARWLREGLELADVHRPELVVPKAGRLLLRAHDLRGSFVTLALATGRPEAWVTDRTGHRSSQMIYLYKRASRTAAELGLGWFAPLDQAIPELTTPKPRRGANGESQAATEVQPRGPSGREASPARSRHAVKQAVRDTSGPSGLLLKSAARKGMRVQVPQGPPRIIGQQARDARWRWKRRAGRENER